LYIVFLEYDFLGCADRILVSTVTIASGTHIEVNYLQASKLLMGVNRLP
jgi:hypothetical protein